MPCFGFVSVLWAWPWARSNSMPAFDLRLLLLSLLSFDSAAFFRDVWSASKPTWHRPDLSRVAETAPRMFLQRCRQLHLTEESGIRKSSSVGNCRPHPCAYAGLLPWRPAHLCCPAALLPLMPWPPLLSPRTLPRKIGRIKLAYQFANQHNWYRKNTNAKSLSSLSSLTCI